MYARVLANDTSCNGRFFTGVLTTGIYCLPACRARKPRPENVRFFPTCEAARAAGLRPCKKCHPDDFARGADPVLADIEALAGLMRRDPAAFADARSVVRRSGFGATRLFELLREHCHHTPADLLLRARLEFAKARLLSSQEGLLEIAAAAGFESVSVFHDHFRRLNGLTPGAYRDLPPARSFAVSLPHRYPVAYLRRSLARDPHALDCRPRPDGCDVAVRVGDQPALLRLSLSPDAVDVEVVGASAAEAHRITIGLLGLDQDAAAFARLARRLGLERLVAGREELRLPQTPSVYDALLWAVLGQQISFPFACLLKRRLLERVGTPLGDGLVAPPTPAAVASLQPADLLPLQFSRQKADYLISIARFVEAGDLDLGKLPGLSATRVARILNAIRGLGPWSVNYVMMRGLGFPDCVPLGDTGVTSGLQSLLDLHERPDADATRRLMSVFSPHRSLATAHLWQLHQPLPA
jgi:AraC family transcriptional regulator of adaptative response / DNA-3-methyladenine glycosylase II